MVVAEVEGEGGSGKGEVKGEEVQRRRQHR